MFQEILEALKNYSRTKKLFFGLVILGYLIGVIVGYPRLNQEIINKEYCAESIGPVSCQPDEDCDRECLRYELRSESRGREAFYTYGLLGAFIGGWAAVFVITYIFKE